MTSYSVRCQPEAVPAVRGHVNGVSLGLEPALHSAGDVSVVLDHQDAHGSASR